MTAGAKIAVLATPISQKQPSRARTLELYDSEHRALRRYLAALGVDPETAKEVVQEAFLKLHQHLLDDGDTSELRAWLYRVVHNLARNIQMSHSVSRTDPLELAVSRGEPAAPDNSAEQQILSSERNRKLQEAVAQLPFTERECLALRAQGLKYREIAQVVGLSTSRVGEAIGNGVTRVRQLMGEANDE